MTEGGSVLAAVSGGADSVALLRMLCEEGRDVTAAHYNHGLRPAADEDEAFVRALCGDWGVPFVAGHGDVRTEAARGKRGMEETAREMRYTFLERARAELSLDWIATAHTADDNAETILLNFTRGAGLSGLCGIPPKRGTIIRPLLDTSRGKILQYLTERGIPHREDESNGDTAYRRNYIRHAVIPALKAVNPSLAGAANRLSALLREDEEYLSSLAQAEWIKHGRENSFPVKQLNSLPKPIASRVCRLLALSVSAYPPERVHIEAMLDIAAGGNGRRADLAGGLTAGKHRNFLYIHRKLTKGRSSCTKTLHPSC